MRPTTIRSASIWRAVSLMPAMTLPDVLRSFTELPNKARACSSHDMGRAFVRSSVEGSLVFLLPVTWTNVT